MSSFELPDTVSAVLCDLWGVVHNGAAPFPAAVAALLRWRHEGRTVILLTNAPRPSERVRARLREIGVPDAAYDAILSSGDVGINWCRANLPGERFGFLGSAADLDALRGAGLVLQPGPARQLICTGFDPARGFDIADYRQLLADMAGQGSLLLNFNPDRLVLREGVPEPCAGALAEAYAALGGEVRQFGKPHAPIYGAALAMIASIRGAPVEPANVVAIGDAFETDMLGAAQAGLQLVYIANGVDAALLQSDDAQGRLDTAARQAGLDGLALLATLPALA